ncbi:MAG: NUDIX hydrolase [Planctomycetota bacterium]
MSQPTLKLVTLGYLFDDQGRTLLLQRTKPPNQGLWSPPGGKIEIGESPFECAAREVAEETGLRPERSSAKLLGLVAEKDYEAAGANYLIFLYGFYRWTGALQAESGGGRLMWHALTALDGLAIPETDRQLFWPRIMAGRPFSLRIRGAGPDLQYGEEPLM